MITSYEEVFERFLQRIKNDRDFFNYTGLSDEEVAELVNDHLNSLLNRAIDRIYEYGNPDFNFYDKDDDLQQFNNKLIPQEINLLADLMYASYANEELNKLKAFEITFRSSELNVFSPANERKSKMEMVKDIEEKAIRNLNNYLARDRNTWEYKKIIGENHGYFQN